MSTEGEQTVAVAIQDAEEIRDPLDGLVEKAALDPGAPFAPEALEGLAELKKENPAAFERLRAQLKSKQCRVTALDEAITENSGDTSGRGPSQSEILLAIAEPAELFHTADGTGYADIQNGGHRETWFIRSKGFRSWLARCFYVKTEGGAPNSEALQAALNVIEAQARFDGPERQVHCRIGGLEGRLYLDIGDPGWRAVEIDRDGWRIVNDPPVRFRRAAGMLPVPVPEPGGSIKALRKFLNLRGDSDFVLVVAWAVAVLFDRGPYPVLVLSGEQGSAKSTAAWILRTLLDPNTAPLRALPREDRDLFITATNGHLLAFDNVSVLRGWLSDTLCRLATGGGFAVRQLYTDQDEVLFDATRPVILNGIEDVLTRPDLADRALPLTLNAIPEEDRRPEQEFRAAFEKERPGILGALLDAVVHGLRMLPQTQLERHPRMADFARWATACETALWPAGAFLAAYCGNREDTVAVVLEADPVATAIRTLMADRTEWTGTATDLLVPLIQIAGERVAKSKAWPHTARALSGRLRRAATFLREIGIEISFSRGGARIIDINKTPDYSEADKEVARPSQPSQPSSPARKLNTLNDAPAAPLVTVALTVPSPSLATVIPTVSKNSLRNNGSDGSDAKLPTQTAPEKLPAEPLDPDDELPAPHNAAAGPDGDREIFEL